MAELRVRRDDFAVCDLVAGEGPREDDLADGEAQLRVERFALTTNNVTYAVLGDQLGYWKPFPAPAGWGRIPAWGYATVTASRSPGVATGARVFGFVPMASYVTMRPIPHPLGFAESAPHRADLSQLAAGRDPLHLVGRHRHAQSKQQASKQNRALRIAGSSPLPLIDERSRARRLKRAGGRVSRRTTSRRRPDVQWILPRGCICGSEHRIRLCCFPSGASHDPLTRPGHATRLGCDGESEARSWRRRARISRS